MSLVSLLTSAAFAPIDNVGWIRVTGEDRVRWLNGMVTNSIQSLKPGEGCYNFFLNAQGRIQADATAWMLEDSILLQTARDRIDSLMAMLDHFIIMDDVVLEPLGNIVRGMAIAGPEAATELTRLNVTIPSGLALAIARSVEQLGGLDMLCLDSPSPSFEIWGKPDKVDELAATLRSRNLAEATAEDVEQLRILSGTPLYGTDIRDKELPQETAQTRALHFSKGCYLGQEIVERIRSRGNVHRTFSGFVLEGDLPAPGTVLTADEMRVGELTSITRIQWPSGPMQLNSREQQLALGYIRREALDRAATLHYPGGIATPAKLPFPLPELRA